MAAPFASNMTGNGNMAINDLITIISITATMLMNTYQMAQKAPRMGLDAGAP